MPAFSLGRSPSSLYAELQRRDLLPTWGEDSVGAALARPEEAELLGVEEGDPVLRIARRAFAAEIAVEVSRSTYRADRFTLWVPLTRPNVSVTARDRCPCQRRTARASIPVLDGHNDLPWALREHCGYDLTQVDLAGGEPAVHTDLPRLRAGGVAGQFWSVFVPCSLAGDAAVTRHPRADRLRAPAGRGVTRTTCALCRTADRGRGRDAPAGGSPR